MRSFQAPTARQQQSEPRSAPIPRKPAPQDRAGTASRLDFHLDRIPLLPPRASSQGLPVQPRLAIGRTDDPHERQADAMADWVMRPTGAPPRNLQGVSGPVVSRRSQGVDGALPASRTGGLEHALASSRGAGRPMPVPVRSEMEQAFGVDFSRVRLHSDGQAAHLNRQLHAHAFTHGTDVYFARGMPDLGSGAGRHLLAHELAHVVQQSGSASSPVVQRKGIGELWEEHVSKPYQSLKESAYGGLIDAVRKAQRAVFSELRAAIAPLPAGRRETLSTIITIFEETVNVLMAAVYAIIGILVGAGEAIVDLIKGVVSLLYAVMDLLVRFVYGFIDGGAAFDESMGQVLAALKGMPAGLKKLVDDWLDRFTKAPTERQSLMIGELTGQVIVFIATLGGAAAKAGQLPKLTLPALARAPALATAGGGAMASGGAGVIAIDVAGPGLAAGLAGTTTFMVRNEGSKGSPGDKEPQVPPATPSKPGYKPAPGVEGDPYHPVKVAERQQGWQQRYPQPPAKAPPRVPIGGKQLTPVFEGEAAKFLADQPTLRPKFENAMQKGVVPPKGQTGIVPSELEGYQYKIKILGQGGDYRIHGKVSGDTIIFDKVTTH
ncbi:eCIS core domain-containing protein [Pyxidicoccus xibeiensis]|uniref:eCIS core domain-containing protein n=1 Tax=Pyxidicoccus xibeiensis TaxID=2906759 RepID=UPI0020A7D480|nr:DUF4157 domain-containing protein [Pyxidicoccus xibeiensis]MCP3143635.1 DUF4157 domain-containing protein [Pyxidicoccus xibeiensis]